MRAYPRVSSALTFLLGFAYCYALGALPMGVLRWRMTGSVVSAAEGALAWPMILSRVSLAEIRRDQ